jgi:hypothetical protein
LDDAKQQPNHGFDLVRLCSIHARLLVASDQHALSRFRSVDKIALCRQIHLRRKRSLHPGGLDVQSRLQEGRHMVVPWPSGPSVSGIPNRLDSPQAGELIAEYALRPILPANMVAMHKRTIELVSDCTSRSTVIKNIISSVLTLASNGPEKERNTV